MEYVSYKLNKCFAHINFSVTFFRLYCNLNSFINAYCYSWAKKALQYQWSYKGIGTYASQEFIGVSVSKFTEVCFASCTTSFFFPSTIFYCNFWLYFRELKLNKGTILKASCDYIRQLQKDRELMLRQQQYQARLEQAARMYADRVKVSKFHWFN